MNKNHIYDKVLWLYLSIFEIHRFTSKFLILFLRIDDYAGSHTRPHFSQNRQTMSEKFIKFIRLYSLVILNCSVCIKKIIQTPEMKQFFSIISIHLFVFVFLSLNI